MIELASVKQGFLKGMAEDGYTLFRGIPYAAPPVGDLRWKAPRDPENWPGVRAAHRWPSRCPHMDHEPGSFYQREFFSDPMFMPDMNEDCLYLNVWTSARSSEERLPVAVYIHGGGYMTGSGCDYEFDGAELSRHGVVMVTINYRLNAFGFLAHPWLTAEAGRSGNYGILDQIAALKWVRENIAAFGGDPGRITIFGQSAGALSVQTLVSSPLTKGMIQGAILQSAGGYNTGIAQDRTLAEAERMGERFAGLCGARSLGQLRKVPAGSIVAAVAKYLQEMREEGGPGLPFAPVIDNYLLEEEYDAIVDHAKHHDIPYMIGLTANDIGQPPDGSKSRLYRGCIDWSLKNEACGRNPAYVYYFTHKPLGDDAGAFHCVELWYVFGILNRSWRPKNELDYRLEKQCLNYWANFIKTGDPNGKGFPEWKVCSASDNYIKILD